MADLGVNQKWLVSPTVEVEKKWKKVKIQELVSKIKNTKQRIEDLILGEKVKLEAAIMMYEMEKSELERELAALDVENADIITTDEA